MTNKNTLALSGDYVLLELTGEALPANKTLENMKKVVQFCEDNNISKGIIYRSESAKQTASRFDFYEFSNFLAYQRLAAVDLLLYSHQKSLKTKLISYKRRP